MIVIDTHVLVWWVSTQKKLSQKAQDAITAEKEDGVILISSISVWEIYMLIQKDRLRLTIDTDTWLKKIESIPYVRFVPIDNTIAAKAVQLPGTLHFDPADRMIVTTAREFGVPLVTADERISEYAYVETIW